MSGPFDSIRQFYDHTVRPIQERVVEVADDVVEAGGVVRDAVADGAHEVAQAVDDAGVLNVSADLFKLHAHDVAGGTDAIVQSALHRSPEDFVDWLTGPEGPSIADYTAQVPGLQAAIGNVIDSAMQNPLIAGAAGKAFGFQYVADGDFYTTNERSFQSYLGFHTVYDKVGKLLGMDLQDRVVEVTVDGVDYRLELWKGSYGSGGAYGGEIGLYTRGTGERGVLGNLLEQIPGYYTSAKGPYEIRTTQTIYDIATGTPYFTNDSQGADGTDGKHFWNLAIHTDPGVDAQEIGQRGTLEFDDPNVAQAICAEMNTKPGVDASLSADGRTITYSWE